MEQKPKRITLATFKSFVAKNRANLFVQVKSSFDGMTDCVERLHDGFDVASPTNTSHANTLGINGVWLVLGSRDYYSHYEDDALIGYRVSNSCGSFIVAIPKQGVA